MLDSLLANIAIARDGPTLAVNREIPNGTR